MSKNLIQALEDAASSLNYIANTACKRDEELMSEAINVRGYARSRANAASEALSRHRSSVESVELPEDEVVAWRDDGQQAANGPLHLCYRVVTSETLASMPRAAAASYTEALYTASTVRSLIAAAVERERELCAKVCKGSANFRRKELRADMAFEADHLTAAIRARGEMK